MTLKQVYDILNRRIAEHDAKVDEARKLVDTCEPETRLMLRTEIVENQAIALALAEAKQEIALTHCAEFAQQRWPEMEDVIDPLLDELNEFSRLVVASDKALNGPRDIVPEEAAISGCINIVRKHARAHRQHQLEEQMKEVRK